LTMDFHLTVFLTKKLASPSLTREFALILFGNI
jgi:hypothetical protein